QNLYRADDVTDLYQPLTELADVVVTRGGSNTSFELVAMRKSHSNVPVGKEASRGDQSENALYHEKKWTGRKSADDRLTLENKQDELNQLFTDEEQYKKQMKESNELKSQDEFYHLMMADISKTAKGI